MAFDNFKFVRDKIQSYKNELSNLKQRKQELEMDMLQASKKDSTSDKTRSSIIVIDELSEKVFESLVKNYELMISILESMAQVPEDERLNQKHPA